MNDRCSQEAVFRLLADPATHGGAAVKRIDTHAASVFLAGDRALKVKRAVRFPFLDYSTLEQRKRACEAEVEINRPFAPDIYRRVLPIARAADGALALDGPGPPVEWAVEMRRFDENATLDRLAEAGIEPSVGSVGDSYDNALAETIFGLFKAEVIWRNGPWRDIGDVELATLEWVHWFNHRRLLSSIGNIPPAELEAMYYERQKSQTTEVGPN